MRGRFTFIFVCTPSRTDLKAYNTLEAEVVQSVIAINKQFGTSDWTPIVLINENVDSDLLAGVYRAADLCVVSSLQDGMNLVAKEFVACQIDERGVLILSRFTGSAEEIDGAVLINPFNIDGFMAGYWKSDRLTFISGTDVTRGWQPTLDRTAIAAATIDETSARA